MTHAQWIDQAGRSPAVWIDHTGKGQIDPSAFAMADETGRQTLIDQAALMEAEFLKLDRSEPAFVSEAFAHRTSPPPTKSDMLLAVDGLVTALIAFATALDRVRNSTASRLADRGDAP